MMHFGNQNAFTALQEMVSPGFPCIATVDIVHGDGTATVNLRGGGRQRVRMAIGASADARVVVQDGVAMSLVPVLPLSSVSVG